MHPNFRGAINDVADWLDKATDCSFGWACSSNGDEKQNQPNIGKELTEKEKLDLGGTGSGIPGDWGRGMNEMPEIKILARQTNVLLNR